MQLANFEPAWETGYMYRYVSSEIYAINLPKKSDPNRNF